MIDNKPIKSTIKAIEQTWHFLDRRTIVLVHSSTSMFWLRLVRPNVLSSPMLKNLKKRLRKVGVKLNNWDISTTEANFFLEVIV